MEENKINIADFKKLVRKAVFLESGEDIYFDAIPDDVWRNIYKTNFNSNYAYAQRVILHRTEAVKEIDIPRVDREKAKIKNLESATKLINDYLASGKKVVFVTDYDNDGSLSQAVIMEYLKLESDKSSQIIMEYAQNLAGNNNRGITIDLVKLISSSYSLPASDFLIVTADNGINSLEEQEKIEKGFPDLKMIITDHHNPEVGMVVEENSNCIIFNPKNDPTDFYKKYNISGAATIGVLLKNAYNNGTSLKDKKKQQHVEIIDKLSRVANLLDYVYTDPADKPENAYDITKFLGLQPLLNVNNSLGKIIHADLDLTILDGLSEKNAEIDINNIKNEIIKIKTNNHYARILLTMFKERDNLISFLDAEHADAILEGEQKLNYDELFLKITTLARKNKNILYSSINPNYIEQLRPLIFNISANDQKDLFLDYLNEHMIHLYENIRKSEKAIMNELRKTEVVDINKTKNSTIMQVNDEVLGIFNRKFITKTYNIENPGFLLTLDSVGKEKISGSFRSLYDISDILPPHGKKIIEEKYGVTIETPGHERAAGFIIKSRSGVISKDIINDINSEIDKNIDSIKFKQSQTKEFLLTDLSAIKVIDKINVVIRGNVSNFEKITPLLLVDKDTVWTDAYSTRQYSLADIAAERKYGYININMNFSGDTVIIPVDLIKRVVSNKYNDYIMLNYMEGGIFMADRLISAHSVENVIDLRDSNIKSKEIKDVFNGSLKSGMISLTRSQIKDNPFYKYHDYGENAFALFEKMVISIIDKESIDCLTVFDVEANGFGNSKLMNIGTMNYFIDEQSGAKLSLDDFNSNTYKRINNEDVLFLSESGGRVEEVPIAEYDKMDHSSRSTLLHKVVNVGENIENKYYRVLNSEGLIRVTNYKIEGNQVVYNRTVRADMLSYIVKDKDFKVPQEMVNLTGITQDILNSCGIETKDVDDKLFKYYKNKKALFGAHNTPYDARVCRANLPKFSDILRNNKIYDSALFAREMKLAYDDVSVSTFDNIKEIPKDIIFYNNIGSDWNLSKFLETAKDGCYPDRSGNYLIEVYSDDFYFIDKTRHEKIKITTPRELLKDSIAIVDFPNKAIKFSVEKLSEQWMIRALLLNNEKFEILKLNTSDYPYLESLPLGVLDILQQNYHFGISIDKNIDNFLDFINKTRENISDDDMEQLVEFCSDFLALNKEINSKYADSWIYKKVLDVKEPEREDATNDTVELVSYQTSVPEDKIRKIYKEVSDFKNKNKIDRVLFHEGHVNGLWEGDNKGDIAFEDKLTLTMLAQKNINSYNKDITNVIKLFEYYQFKAQLSFDISNIMSDGLASDSYSYRQAILYDRDSLSENIQKMQSKEKALSSEDVGVIKFKLGNDTLAPDTSVLAIKKEGVVISREQLESDADKIRFIATYEQLKNSIEAKTWKVPATTKENCNMILSSSYKKVTEYYDDLNERYGYMEFSRRDAEMRNVMEGLVDALFGGKMKKMEISELDSEAIEKVNKILDKYSAEIIRRYGSVMQPNVDAVRAKWENELNNHAMPKIEQMLAGDISITGRLILNVDITRRDPIKTILYKFSDLDFIQEYIKNEILNKENANRPKI